MVVSNCVQSTGHDILMFYIDFISQLVEEREFPAWPIMLDTHDSTMWETEEANGPELKLIFEEALHRLNNFLQGEQTRPIIKLRGDAALIHNLAADKGLDPDD